MHSCVFAHTALIKAISVILTNKCTKAKKVKCTLAQALRLCTGHTAHRGSRGIALLFHDQRHQKGVTGQRHAPAALYPRERPGTRCTGGWVGPRAGLHRCGKSRPHQDSIPRQSSPQPVAIPTELPGPQQMHKLSLKFTIMFCKNTKLLHVADIS